MEFGMRLVLIGELEYSWHWKNEENTVI
jgi:hypothetical protein